jgi:hypothetical protein
MAQQRLRVAGPEDDGGDRLRRRSTRWTWAG